MNRIIALLSILTASLINWSCEQTVTGVELPYKEQLVIRAVLEAGEPIKNIRVERTLPPLEPYTEASALVTNAVLVIKNRDKSVTLKYSNGYYTTDEIIPITGETYSLTATWKDKKATASTYIPKPVEYGNIDFEIIEEKYWDGQKQYNPLFFTYIKSEKNVVYKANTIFQTWRDYIAWESNMHRAIEANNDGLLKVNLLVYNDGNRVIDINKIDSAAIRALLRLYYPKFNIYAYDDALYSYYITKDNGQSSGDIFGIGGNNVSWNVRGDGIGMFIGLSVSSYEY